ncbi:hypothetical protein AC579_5860 [Pseudocercospora musae]|uniref:Uncharacterized protein n=1 Tax=Pseudocercospora musae TaxID=113226 RepID=A0A139ILE8_9PEZI|nr:hypothetical protein AC579_5860 [Pseudocercospora musae]
MIRQSTSMMTSRFTNRHDIIIASDGSKTSSNRDYFDKQAPQMRQTIAQQRIRLISQHTASEPAKLRLIGDVAAQSTSLLEQRTFGYRNQRKGIEHWLRN